MEGSWRGWLFGELARNGFSDVIANTRWGCGILNNALIVRTLIGLKTRTNISTAVLRRPNPIRRNCHLKTRSITHLRFEDETFEQFDVQRLFLCNGYSHSVAAACQSCCYYYVPSFLSPNFWPWNSRSLTANSPFLGQEMIHFLL